MKSKYMLPIALLVFGLATGFAGGYYFKSYNQQKQIGLMRNGVRQRTEMPNDIKNIQRGNMQAGLGSINGEIISIDDNSVTVKLNDGSSKIILISASTSFSNLNEAKKEDIKTGAKVMIFGKTNTDGSLTADSIQF